VSWRRLVLLAAVTPLLLMPSAGADVVHQKESWVHQTTVAHDFNVCGDLATFTFDARGHLFTTDTGSGFHVSYQDHYTYTLVFDDPALGTWSARTTETGSFHATPGGAGVDRFTLVAFEGPVTIRERFVFVVDAKGEVRVDTDVAEVDGC